MFGFLFKKSKGSDKESKGSLKQSAKDLLSRRNSTTSAVSTTSSNNSASISTLPTCSSGGSCPATIASKSKKSKSMDSLIEDGRGEVEYEIKEGVDTPLEIVSPIMAEKRPQQIPVVLVSSDSLTDLTKPEECEGAVSPKQSYEERRSDSARSQSEDRSCCSSRCGSSQNGESNSQFGAVPRSSSLVNLLQSSSGEEISSTSGIGMSEDVMLKSLMSDTEIEFIDETVDDNENVDTDNACFEDNEINDNNLEDDDDVRELKDTERKAMMQLEELRSKLISKETELSLLQADISMLAVDRDNKIMEVEGMSTQLKALRDENDMSLKRIQKLESELEDLRAKNNQLSDDLLKKAEQLRCLESSSMKVEIDTGDLQVRMKEYESKLRDMESEKNKILKERKSYEIEREEEIKALQEALDDTVAEKNRLQNKFNHDFAELQSANTSLIDDFEWKLRQIEANCKKKIQEKDKQIQDKIKEVKDNMTDEFKVERERLEQEKHQLQEQLKHVAHLKSHEVELTQLRGLTHEQEKSLRSASRQIEHLKLNEKILQDELRTLKKLLDQEKAHLTVVQNSAQRRMDFHEENMRSKLEKQKNELNSNWESKLREECSKLKKELCRFHAEEKQLALDSMKSQKDHELGSAKQMWEKQRQELQHEVSKLKDEISKKEVECQKEISRAMTISDRENMDLRRRVDKLSIAHMEELEEIRASHSEEMETLKERYETTVAQLQKLEKLVNRFEKLYGTLPEEEEVAQEKEINEDCASVKSKLDEDGSSEDEDEDEEEDDEENSEKENDKEAVDKKETKDSSESLEEIEDEDDEDDEESEESDDLVDTSSDNKNALYVMEVKDVPPTNLTVVDIGAEDDSKRDLSSDVPNTTTSSSFISTSSESESENKDGDDDDDDDDENPKKKSFCPSSNTIASTGMNNSFSTYSSPEMVHPNPPARKKSLGGRGVFHDGTFPRLAPYGKSKSATMSSCTLS